MIRMLGVDETGGLLTVHLLCKVPMQKGVGNVQLMHRPSARDRQPKDGADRARFYNRGESVGEVHIGTLAKSANHPTSFVALERTARMCLVAEHPLATDDVSMGRPRNKMPHTVALQRVELLPHRRKPMRIAKGCASGGGNG